MEKIKLTYFDASRPKQTKKMLFYNECELGNVFSIFPFLSLRKNKNAKLFSKRMLNTLLLII